MHIDWLAIKNRLRKLLKLIKKQEEGLEPKETKQGGGFFHFLGFGAAHQTPSGPASTNDALDTDLNDWNIDNYREELEFDIKELNLDTIVEDSKMEGNSYFEEEEWNDDF